MTERPINLHAHEVRAYLAGNLGLIVRPVKDSVDFLGAGGSAGPEWNDPNCWGWEDPENPCHFLVLGRNPTQSNETPIRSPFGQPGDKLWGRETWGIVSSVVAAVRVPIANNYCAYRADNPNPKPLVWKPSTHMPRWASRITLEVTGLRIERLNDISEADAIAEGCDVDLLASLIAPLANRAVVEPHYWLRNDAGRSFCRKCGEKKVRQINKDCREKNENLDGGWDTEEDGPAFCETCGVMLDCTYTDHAVRDEIDHFSEYGITSPADAHSLETALHVHGNPRLTKSCGTFHYRPELTGTVAKICFRHLWESINGPDSWDANPWVWVVEFQRKGGE